MSEDEVNQSINRGTTVCGPLTPAESESGAGTSAGIGKKQHHGSPIQQRLVENFKVVGGEGRQRKERRVGEKGGERGQHFVEEGFIPPFVLLVFFVRGAFPFVSGLSFNC